MAGHVRSYAIPCALYSRADNFFHTDETRRPGLALLSITRDTSTPRKRVMRGAVSRGRGTVLLERRVVPFDITQAAHASAQFETLWWHFYLRDMTRELDPTDYSFVVKRRGSPPKPWRWEIYRAGKPKPVMRSAVFLKAWHKQLKREKRH
jgi:hypothetical protein